MNKGNPELAGVLRGVSQAEVWAYVEANLFTQFVDSMRSAYAPQGRRYFRWTPDV